MAFPLILVAGIICGFIVLSLIFNWMFALVLIAIFAIAFFVFTFLFDFYTKVKLNKIRRQYDKEKNESGPDSRPENFRGANFERRIIEAERTVTPVTTRELPVSNQPVSQRSGADQYNDVDRDGKIEVKSNGLITDTGQVKRSSKRHRYNPI